MVVLMIYGLINGIRGQFLKWDIRDRIRGLDRSRDLSGKVGVKID